MSPKFLFLLGSLFLFAGEYTLLLRLPYFRLPVFYSSVSNIATNIGFSIFLESSIQRTLKLWIKIRKSILKFEFRWKLEALGVGGLNSKEFLEV